MAEQKQCPLKVAAAKGITDDTACTPDCAWYVKTGGGECAIKHIADIIN